MNTHCRKKQWLALLFAVVVILIMAGSLVPVAEIPEQEKTFWEKMMSVITNLMHVPMYGVLTLVSLHYFDCIRYSRKKGVVVSILIAMSVGILNEILQIFVPGRYGSLTDIILNVFGIIAGVVLYGKICQKTLD
jgi:VanZ family protein